MSNSTHPLDAAPVTVETKQPACHLVPSVPLAQAGERRETAVPLRTIGRPDSLTAQRIEVGIVLNAMLGKSAATDYLSKHAVDDCVIQRVLSASGRRRGEHDASGVQI